MDSDAALRSQGGTISARAKACQQLFSHCLSPTTPRCAEWPAQWLQMRQAEFNLWAYGLQALGTSKASLDYRVRDRNDVRLMILGLLSALCEDLQECLRIDAELSRKTEDTATSNDTAGAPEDDIGFFDVSDEGIEVDSHPSESGDAHFGSQKFSLRLTITELARFSSMMRRSGTEFRFRRADSCLVESEYRDYEEELGRSILLGSLKIEQGAPIDIGRFQSAAAFDQLTVVQRRLIRGNILRRNRIVHATKNMRTSKTPQLPRPQEMTKALQAVTAEEKPNDVAEGPVSLEEPRPISEPAHTQTQEAPSLVESRMTGLTAQTATEIGQHFQSDLPAPKATPSVATKVTRTGAIQDYPRCPEPITDEFIQCPYCADMLPAGYTRNVVRWKGHVAQDILPYMCVFEDCKTPEEMYLTSDDLLKHVQDHHSTLQWVCSQCARSQDPDQSRFSTFHTMAAWQAHTRAAHKSLVPDSSLASLAKFSEARVLEPVSCPLCAYSSAGVQKTLDQHIIQHIHEFSLRSLPWGTREDDAKTVSNTRTAESDSTSFSDSTSLSDDVKLNIDIEDQVFVGRLEATRHRYRSLSYGGDRVDRTFSPDELIWSANLRQKVFSRISNLARGLGRICDHFPSAKNYDTGISPLARACNMLFMVVKYIEHGGDFLSWGDGSSHTIMSLLDELEAESQGIEDDCQSNSRPKDLSIRPLSFDIPSLDDNVESNEALDPLFHRAMLFQGRFGIILAGPSALENTSIISRVASNFNIHSPDPQVFWVDIQALGMGDDHCLAKWDWVLGQIGIQLLEMKDLLDVLAIADRGPAFVEAMLKIMNQKAKKDWVIVCDGVTTDLNAFFTELQLPDRRVMGTAIFTTQREEVADLPSCQVANLYTHHSPARKWFDCYYKKQKASDDPIGMDRVLRLMSQGEQVANMIRELNETTKIPDSQHWRRTRIRIAVVDTGIDWNDELIKAEGGRIEAVPTMVQEDRGGCRDDHGHGTHVARLLLSLSPLAQLYVAKIADNPTIEDDNSGRIARVMKRITMWAQMEGVHIICVPHWRRFETTGLLQWIREAQENVLFFVGDSTDFFGSEERYMSRADRSDGALYVQASDDHDDHIPRPLTSVPTKWRRVAALLSGWSFAAPVAAAIACNIFDIARLCWPSISEDEMRRLCTFDVVQAVLQELTVAVDDHDFLSPSALLQKDHLIDVVKRELHIHKASISRGLVE